MLTISVQAWERLSKDVDGLKTDLQAAPAPSNPELGKTLALQWLAITAGAASFYYFVPRLEGAKTAVPLAVCILFPGIFFGIVQLVRYVRQRRR